MSPRRLLPSAAALVLAVLALAGCTRERVQEAQTAGKFLVGRPIGDVLACAGRPDRVAGPAGLQTYTWLEGSRFADVHAADPPTERGGSNFGAGSRWCQMDVSTGDGGVVRDVRFSGNTGSVYGRGAECAGLLRSCGPKPPAASPPR